MSTDPGAAMVAALMSLSASIIEPLNEAVDGYRADLERRGYSPTACEAMAMDYHRLLFAQVMKSLG